MLVAGADVVVGAVVVDVGAELVVVVATGCVVVVATATSAFDTLVVSVDSAGSDSTAGADVAVVVISRQNHYKIQMNLFHSLWTHFNYGEQKKRL